MSNAPPQKQRNSPAGQDLTGATVGRFLIHARLGAGGMGEVYRAEDTMLKRTVALKRISPELRADPQFRQRLLQEAQYASRLTDPHIAAIYDVFESDGESFIVMEYVEGETLRERLVRPMSPQEFEPFAIQCAAALTAAHEAGILHRDVKPSNIMLTPRGQVKVLDFGVARPTAGAAEGDTADSASSQPDDRAGTPAYMAPEVLLGTAVDGRADIFALGVVFYQALTGRHPFQALSTLATSNRILHEEPSAPTRLNPAIPLGLETIILKMLAKDPAGRYARADLLLAELRREGPRHAPPGAATGMPSPAENAKRRLWTLAALALVGLLLAVAGYRAWQPRLNEQHSGAADRPVRSIAILPFRNIGRSPGDDYFGVGLAEVLNAKLTNARFLEVHSPGIITATERDASPLEAGHRLNVDTVLSGSYHIEGGTLSLSYTLVDVRRNVEIAGNALTSPFDQTIAVEHHLAGVIVDSLKFSASQEERARFTAAPTKDYEAFQGYLRSNYEMEQFWRNPSAAQLERVERELEGALRLDPNFVLAMVSLARVEWIGTFWGHPTSPNGLEKAEELLRRAIEIDPGFGEAYAARALLEFQRGQLDEARTSLREAFSRSPNSALAYYAAGFYYLGRGLADFSTRAFSQARRLEPQLVRRELGYTYWYAGDLARAEKQFREDLAAYPDDLPLTARLAVVMAERGDAAGAGELERSS
jgi:tetratricopeptide (TPR) repeat protein/predicted Ser/Thr protein kinase